jgi:hypothetical protein
MLNGGGNVSSLTLAGELCTSMKQTAWLLVSNTVFPGFFIQGLRSNNPY